MSKQQLFKRIFPVVVVRTLRDFNDKRISTREAMDALGVGRSRLYDMRTEWLAKGRSRNYAPGVSGGDHADAWPKECLDHLERMILSSGIHGPNYELYADELDRLFGFKRDRSNVRKYCETHMEKLLRKVFPIERKPKDRMRRWAKSNFGELVQHDSTPLNLWGPPSSKQTIIISKDDATRNVLACRVCVRETIEQHFAAMEQMIGHVGIPEEMYTDGFKMFGEAGEDLRSQFGRACRALGILHRIASTPQAKGKIERDMRTFQHRLAVVFRSQGVDNEEDANEVAFEHYRHWNSRHVHKELGCTPFEARERCMEEGKCSMKEPPAFTRVQMILSLRARRRVELGTRIEFGGKWWTIARTLRKSVYVAYRPIHREFYVFEDDIDPTARDLPRVLGKYSY